eukprot:gene10930-14638_t
MFCGPLFPLVVASDLFSSVAALKPKNRKIRDKKLGNCPKNVRRYSFFISTSYLIAGVNMAIPRAAQTQRRTRIQEAKEEVILEAALEVFSQRGFHGSTIDQIAEVADMSKPNLLYYFRTKEAMHRALIDRVLENWLEPLKAFDADGDPQEEICSYIRRKLEMARDFPRESRLFANEVLQGAPHIVG